MLMLTVLLLIVPMLAGVVALLTGGASAKTISLGSSLLTLGLCLYGVLVAGAPLSFDASWIELLGARFTLSMDGGLSKLMVLLTALVYPPLYLAFTQRAVDRPGVFYGLMSLSQVGLMGVFMAQDALLFYLFWEVALIPVYFLSSLYGGERRIPVSFKFFVYTFLGSLVMLVGMIIIYRHSGLRSFALNDFITAGREFSGIEQQGLFWMLFLAFAIKMPIFPFHTWQPDAYEQSATPVTVVLSALMVKMGLFAVAVWLLPVLPLGVAHWTPLVMGLSVAGIVYASCMALVQNNMKRVVAYSSIAHIGLMAAALFSNNGLATQGAYIQMFNHGITILGMWLLLSMIEERTETQNMSELGGIASVAPRFTIALVLIAFANIALPLTNGFPGEFLMFTGLFSSGVANAHTLTVVAGLAVILSAAYTLWMVQKIVFGETNARTASFRDLNTTELISLSFILLMILALGIYPNAILAWVPWAG